MKTARERELEQENQRLREANRRLQTTGAALERDKLIIQLRRRIAELEAKAAPARARIEMAKVRDDLQPIEDTLVEVEDALEARYSKNDWWSQTMSLFSQALQTMTPEQLTAFKASTVYRETVDEDYEAPEDEPETGLSW
jgi:hypothetical protein